MKVSEFKTAMDGKFAAVDERFERVDERFEQIDRRFEQVDGTLQDLRLLITSESEATRRHFDVVAEKMVSERNLSLDRSMATAQQLVGLTASNAADHVDFERRLDDHDRRLETIEKGRSADPDQA
jgi:tetrahydromethanopterin S-methyltransferase subunit G